MPDDRTICQTPTPGKKPTRIPTWKYAAVRAAILEVVPDAAPGVAAKDLAGLVATKLSNEVKKNLGSVMWHTTAVKLNMEVDGELARLPKVRPQHLVRTR